MVLGSGCPWEPFTWRSQMPWPCVDSDALPRYWGGCKAERQLSVHQEDGKPPVTGGTSQPLPSSLCPGQPLSRQGRLRQRRLEHVPVWGGKAAALCSAWKSLSCCCLQPIQSQLFSRLLKISLGLASCMSSAASLSHVLPSPMSQGTLTCISTIHGAWAEKPSCTLVYMDGYWRRQGVPGSATKTKARKGGVCCSTGGHRYNTTGSRAVHTQWTCTPQRVKNEGEWVLLIYVSGKDVRLMLPGRQQQTQVILDPGQVVAALLP